MSGHRGLSASGGSGQTLKKALRLSERVVGIEPERTLRLAQR